jgi:hypothetical protein
MPSPAYVDHGKPFKTGEECPKCFFDSVIAILLIINGVPRFAWRCGRKVCRDAPLPPEGT